MQGIRKIGKNWTFAILITAIVYIGIFNGSAERYPLVYLGGIVGFYILLFIISKNNNKRKQNFEK